jgi:hypothetical protein
MLLIILKSQLRTTLETIRSFLCGSSGIILLCDWTQRCLLIKRKNGKLILPSEVMNYRLWRKRRGGIID